jgi:hypothetical protein
MTCYRKDNSSAVANKYSIRAFNDNNFLVNFKLVENT